MQLPTFFESILNPVRNAFAGGYRLAANHDLRSLLGAMEQTIAHYEERVAWLEAAVGKTEAVAEQVVDVIEPVAPTQTAGDVSSAEPAALAPVEEAAAVPAVDATAAAPHE